MRVRPRVLVVDDDRAILTLVGSVAVAEGFDVATTVDGTSALQQLATRPADLVLVDLRMPGVTGLEVLRSIRDVDPRSRVVLMSGHATIDSAVMAVKLGATDYLTKPFDLQRLRQLLSVVRTESDERRALLKLEGDAARHIEFCGMIGRGQVMQDVFELIRRLAPHARTALVSGETGTGKELCRAGLAHARSAERQAAGDGELLGGRRSVSNFSTDGPTVTAFELESLGREGTIAGAPALLARLEREVALLLDQLRAFDATP